MLGIDGIGFVHAAGVDWEGIWQTLADPHSRKSIKVLPEGDVEGFFVPPLPQPAVPNGRRFSPWLKMTLAAGQSAMQNSTGSWEETSLGVIGATSLGSLQHTAAFVENMIRNQEDGPQPANFILSVHNAATAQVAIALKAKGYSNTVSHDGTSFEQALLIAQCQVAQEPESGFVVFGADEWIPLLHTARLASCRRRPDLQHQSGWGRCGKPDLAGNFSLPGEGAAALRVGKPQPGQVCIKTVCLRCFAAIANDTQARAAWVEESIRAAGLGWDAIDLIMTPDTKSGILETIREAGDIPQMACGQWLGTFDTASAFVIAIAAALLKTPEKRLDMLPKKLRTILVINETANHNCAVTVVGR